MLDVAGVIGTGSFGVTISKLLARNTKVLLYARKQDTADLINTTHEYLGYKISDNVVATNDMKLVADSCKVIFPAVPSSGFRSMMQNLGPLLNPGHCLIHATKGFDTSGKTDDDLLEGNFTKEDIKSMSEVIMDESSVLRIGAMSGPNLAREILDGQPAATVIASEFDEVIVLGRELLRSNNFFVFASNDTKGAEIAGAFKNILALASGMLGGLRLGKNIQALLISRGLSEMIRFGEAMGAEKRSFLGIAGIGDLIATATSEKSRNYTFGTKLAKGMTLEQTLSDSSEVVEGVRTLMIVNMISQQQNLRLPITEMIYRIIFDKFPMKEAIPFLMSYRYTHETDFY